MQALFLLSLASLPLLLSLVFLSFCAAFLVGMKRRSLADGFKVFIAPTILLASSFGGAICGVSVAEALKRMAELSSQIPHPTALVIGALVGAISGSLLLWGLFTPRNSAQTA